MATKKYLELVELPDADLINELEGAEADYRKMRFDHSTKGLDNPIALREMRKDVARIKSEIRRREIAQMTSEEIAMRSKIRARRKNN